MRIVSPSESNMQYQPTNQQNEKKTNDESINYNIKESEDYSKNFNYNSIRKLRVKNDKRLLRENQR